MNIPKFAQDIMKQYDQVDRETEATLSQELLVLHSVRFAVFYVKRWCDKGVPDEQIIEEAIVAMVEAAQSFDPKQNTRFVTYCTPYIRSRVTKAINSAVHQVSRNSVQSWKLSKVKRFCEEYRREFGHEPDYEEISEATGFAERTIRGLYNTDITGQVSLNQFTGDGDGRSVEEMIPSNYETPDSAFNRKLLSDAIMKAMDSLTDRERSVIHLRIFEDKKLSQIGSILGISTPGVKGIEGRALSKLKSMLGSEFAAIDFCEA